MALKQKTPVKNNSLWQESVQAAKGPEGQGDLGQQNRMNQGKTGKKKR
jgi:hypothetical protein